MTDSGCKSKPCEKCLWCGALAFWPLSSSQIYQSDAYHNNAKRDETGQRWQKSAQAFQSGPATVYGGTLTQKRAGRVVRRLLTRTKSANTQRGSTPTARRRELHSNAFKPKRTDSWRGWGGGDFPQTYARLDHTHKRGRNVNDFIEKRSPEQPLFKGIPNT